MQRSRNGRLTQTASSDGAPTGRARQRAVMIAALPEGEDLAELQELLRTAGVATVGQLVQHREHPHPNTYLGPGKLTELKAALKEADANVVAVDDELSPRQERNLEKELGETPVIDRTAIILDIFADHAHPAAGTTASPTTPTRPMASSRSSSPSSSTTSPACAACGRTSSVSARAAWTAASAREVPASRRSRPTAAWPATASPRCAASSRTSRARARSCAPSASGPTCRRSPWPATRT